MAMKTIKTGNRTRRAAAGGKEDLELPLPQEIAGTLLEAWMMSTSMAPDDVKDFCGSGLK